MTTPIGAPPGYGQKTAPNPARGTAVFAALAAVVGLGIGLVIAALIFSGGAGKGMSENYASAEYETEVFCTYTAAAIAAGDAEQFDFFSPEFWRMYALANLANAASSGAPAFADYQDFRGNDLRDAFGSAQTEDIAAALEELQAYCDSRDRG